MTATEEVKSDIDPRETSAREYLMERVDALRQKIGGYVAAKIEVGRHATGEPEGPEVSIYATARGGWFVGKYRSFDEAEAQVLSEPSARAAAEKLRAQAQELLGRAAKLEAGQ